MTKYLELEGLQRFKTKQDEYNAGIYAEKSDVPTKVSQLVNDSAFQTSSQVQSAISAAVASAYKYKGSKGLVSDLPTTGNVIGDVWNVESDGMNYAWTGSAWDALGTTVDLTSYALKNHTHSAATASAAGFMAAADKSKLDGIATGANKYTLPAATSSALGGVKTGSNITNTSGTISLTKENVTNALGYTPPTTNTTYSVATASANGLMSSSDKTKLDGISSISTTEVDALFSS